MQPVWLQVIPRQLYLVAKPFAFAVFESHVVAATCIIALTKQHICNKTAIVAVQQMLKMRYVTVNHVNV